MARAKIRHAGTLAEAFGKVLSERRDERKMTQIDLAVASQYSVRFIGQIERGAKSPTLRTMEKLASLLDIRLGTLIVQAEQLVDCEFREKAKAPDRKGPKLKPERTKPKSK